MFNPLFIFVSVFFNLLFTLQLVAHANEIEKHNLVLSIDDHTTTDIQFTARPLYLIRKMKDSKLKQKLLSCSKNNLKKTDFSIAHRGAPLKYPEHTKESYIAAAKMGAGFLECDVTFTKDKELVCRHSQCDLHTTTNILETSLASKCSVPFQAVELESNGTIKKDASAKCCTSDVTAAEFKTLKGKMNFENKKASTIKEYLHGNAQNRTNSHSNMGTLLTHAESIALFQSLKVKMMPELKTPKVDMPYKGMSQQDYAQIMINEYKKAGINPKTVWPQSFNLNDINYWIKNEPKFGKHSIYLDVTVLDSKKYQEAISNLPKISALGINIIATPIWALVKLDSNNRIVPSNYAIAAKIANLDIITWTLERSGKLKNGGGWYYQTVSKVIKNEGDIMEMLHILAKDVGVIGVFSDWPATTTYYANCMDL